MQTTAIVILRFAQSGVQMAVHPHRSPAGKIQHHPHLAGVKTEAQRSQESYPESHSERVGELGFDCRVQAIGMTDGISHIDGIDRQTRT